MRPDGTVRIEGRAVQASARGPIRRRLIAWFSRCQRVLPWRTEPTPYRVWVSEIMLQQTQVATVVPYFERFVARFGDVASLAAAPLEEVLALWSGLGYYSRARHLHRSARLVVEQHGGQIPDDLAGLMTLPGVGRYTAGAILSIAFNRPAAILDGNVSRVLSRLFAIGPERSGQGRQRLLWGLAGWLVDPRRPSQFNQAMMELGALVCEPTAPDCPACPLARQCRADALGRAEEFPPARPTRRPAVERWAVAVIERRGDWLMVRRPPQGRWAGLWELPGLIVPAGEVPADALRVFLRQRLALPRCRLKSIGQVRHLLTHRDMRVDLFAAEVGRSLVDGATDRAWATPGSFGELAVSALTRKLAEAAGRLSP